MKLNAILTEANDNKKRLENAQKMGFNTSKVYYHGTNKDFKEFARVATDRFDNFLPTGEKRTGYYFTINPNDASHYADGAATNDGRATVYQVFLRFKNAYQAKPGEFGYYVVKSARDRLISQGYDAVEVIADYGEVMTVVFNSNQIRSVNANFDPTKSESSDITA